MEKLAYPIVIFDSGVGGLSVYQEIKQMLPQIEVIYCADTQTFPYGSKPEEEVIEGTSRCLAVPGPINFCQYPQPDDVTSKNG